MVTHDGEFRLSVSAQIGLVGTRNNKTKINVHLTEVLASFIQCKWIFLASVLHRAELRNNTLKARKVKIDPLAAMSDGYLIVMIHSPQARIKLLKLIASIIESLFSFSKVLFELE